MKNHEVSQPALDGVFIVELGHRIAAGLAGSLLAQAGADVVIVEAERCSAPTKWDHRALLAAGKRSIPQDAVPVGSALLRDLIASADVIIVSDLDGDDYRLLTEHADARQIVCDISAFGSKGPLAGDTDSDLLLQAVSGVMDVTGLPTEAPTPIGLPVVEVSAAIYAASAVTAALRYRDYGGSGQRVEISLYDCAVNAQATFLPFYFVGRSPRRAGNRHSMCAPWNCYQSKDRWILICSATNDQWLRLCNVMDRADLSLRPDLATLADRLARCDEVDDAVQLWVGERTTAECIEALGNAGLACGPIVPVEALPNEPNMVRRRFLQQLRDPVSGAAVAIPASPFHRAPVLGRTPDSIPMPGADLDFVMEVLARRDSTSGIANKALQLDTPLADICVLEIGQYTTAPLAARHLATLGANVFKIEPPQGEASRFWPPHKNGQGYFFTLSNNDKHSVMIDLDTQGGQRDFQALLRKADVFVENTKPGSLERRGFGSRELAEINPRLIYCAISGFGYESAYPHRPAFDTVIQAMSGVMDLTRSGGIPVKAGISVADILGGEFALLAILLALKHRDATGKGMFIDLAMQDTCVWSTQLGWNKEVAPRESAVVRCADAFVAMDASQRDLILALDGGEAAAIGADELLTRLAARQLKARRVLTVSEAAESAQCRARELLLSRPDREGTEWPLLGSPMRLSKTPALVRSSIGALGSGNGLISAMTKSSVPLGRDGRL